MDINTLFELTLNSPHSDEGVKAYVDRISGGFVDYGDVAKELGVQKFQLYRWIKAKPHFIQVAVRSILLKMLAEKLRAQKA